MFDHVTSKRFYFFFAKQTNTFGASSSTNIFNKIKRIVQPTFIMHKNKSILKQFSTNIFKYIRTKGLSPRHYHHCRHLLGLAHPHYGHFKQALAEHIYNFR